MKPQRNNPNTPEYTPQLIILNEFIDFILNLDSKKSAHVKKDVIKVVECLKFIKVNLAFIGYAVEHKKDTHIYTYSKDQAKGVLRDFNDTAMHLNAYHSSEAVQSALLTLVQQFENAIQVMRDTGELEIFAYQLEYDKHIGCIEERTAKALSFAAVRLSSPTSHALDDLMGQCGFDPNDDSATAFARANDFLKSYIGQACSWEDKDHILDESLIKRYLTKVFGFEYETSFSEMLAIFERGSTEECLSLIEKMSSSKWDEMLLNPEHDSDFLLTFFEDQPATVCLALIDKVTASALEQALGRQSRETCRLNALRIALICQSSSVCLALLKKIDTISIKSLSVGTSDIFFQEIKSVLFRKNSYYVPHLKIAITIPPMIIAIIVLEIVLQVCAVLVVGTLIPVGIGVAIAIALAIAVGIAIRKTVPRAHELGLPGYLDDICSSQSPEVLVEFFSKLPLQQHKQIILPLNLPQMQRRLPHFLLSKDLQPESTTAFQRYLYSYQPLRDKLVSSKDSLLANCIDFYFEGKGEIAPIVKPLFIECLNAKNSVLSQKEKAFLEVLEGVAPSISVPVDSDPYATWKRGVSSWHNYRAYRLQENNHQLQSVLDRLASADLVLHGSRAPLTDFFGRSAHPVNGEEAVADDCAAAQQASACIQQTKGLVKIVKPENWKSFIGQLENLTNRPNLRCKIYSPTHKFVHLTGEIVSYQKKRRNKSGYTHTKKTSTTLLSPQQSTSVFGEYDATRLLVGILFNQDQCQIKAMLLKDSGTVRHTWLGNQTDVMDYKATMRIINQTNLTTFTEEVKHQFHPNEVLAKVNKEAMRAIVIARDTPEARRTAIERREEIKEKLSIHLPIIFYTTSLQTLRHYTLSEQNDDIHAWAEKQKVCMLREQASKKNVLAIYNACLNRPAWQLGLFGSSARTQNKPIPKTIVFFAKVVDKASQSEGAESSSCTWVEAEQNIKDILVKKTTQGRFFKLSNGRSDDTVAFYKGLLASVNHNPCTPPHVGIQQYPGL